jgi:hypothetical protein
MNQLTASYVKVPDLETTPTVPGWKMLAGMMPILHPPPSSGAMTPGQLGPTILDLDWLLSACAI